MPLPRYRASRIKRIGELEPSRVALTFRRWRVDAARADDYHASHADSVPMSFDAMFYER